jgi:glycosyltransferase involved in cell wall biosynthesis
MRIVLVNWAKIWDGATQGGGVNGYCQALALSLVRLGHDVVYLSSGTSFVPLTHDGASDLAAPGPCAVCRHPDWLGVRVFEVVNSPVIAPSHLQFNDPAGEVTNPELESRLAEFFATLAADVVHFHNIEGFTAGCVRAARSAGASVVYSLHNYHTICPQSYLMRGHRSPCFDSRNGSACVSCMEAPEPSDARQRSAAAYAKLVAPAPSGPPPALSAEPAARPPTWAQLAAAVKRKLLGASMPEGSRHEAITPSAPPAPTPPIALPAPEVRGVADVLAPRPVADDTRGKTAFITGKLGPPQLPGIGHEEWIPLENDAAAEPHSAEPANAYAGRRRAMIDMLNACDRVLAVSSFVRDKFISMGVDESRIQRQTIGTALNRTVRASADLLFDPPEFNPLAPRPIRLVFLGFNSFYKGLHMLLDSLELLTPEYTQRIHLFVYAKDGQHMEWRLRRLEPRLGGLTMHHGYEPWDIPWIMGGKDATIVPSVWWDNAPQTVFESMACGVPVIGARLGGIPDFIRHGHNGLLFRGNDRFDLARTLVGLVKNPQLLTEMRRNVRPPKDIDDHARELETLYAGCLPSSGSPPSTGPAGAGGQVQFPAGHLIPN